MLGIKINNEYLDLPADIGLEMERNNPYLTDDIPGEYSLGLTIKYTDRNYRILTHAGNFYRKNEKLLFDAAIYDKGGFRYGGVLVINQHSSNLNRISETSWTGFFTIGSSSFFQQIKDVRLQDIDYGGTRTFPFTTDNHWDGSGGFWQHIHAARVPNSFPYTFFPIYNINNGWSEIYSASWMNRVNDYNNFLSGLGYELHFVDTNAISIVPAIYLSFLLEQVFKSAGWKLAGNVLTDPGFMKLTMQSFQAIRWCDFKWNLGHSKFLFTALPNVSFDLADHVPQSKTVGQLVTNLKTRFGWYFDFDSNTKTAYLLAYKNHNNTSAKNWTRYVSAGYNAEYQEPAKIFSLINNIDSNDTYPVILKIDESELLPPVYSIETLPDASLYAEGTAIFVFLQNSYYATQYNTGSGVFEWIFFSHNVGNYEPDKADTSIESDIGTMPVEIRYHRSGYQALIPVCHQLGNFFNSKVGVQDWGMRLLFYHGMVSDQKQDNSFTGALLYPYASCHNLTIDNHELGAWSIPYRHEYLAVNDGTYDYWWKEWLKLLSIQDTRTFTLQLPITELKKFSFNDTIVIDNVFFVVVSFKEVLPYKGVSEFKMKRIY